MGLATAAGVAGELRELIGGSNKNDGNSSENKETLLIVDLGDSRRFGLPTSMVSRLEEVSPSKIEHADGHEVIQYRGVIMPLVRLADVFGVARAAETGDRDLQIVVYAEGDRHYGMVVNRIIDIVETELKFAKAKKPDQNLLGTTVIQQHVTDVLNLNRLAREYGESA